MRILLLTLLSAAAASGQWQILTSFENDQELQILRPRNTRIEVVEQGVTDGAKALRIEFDAVAWPSLWFSPAQAFDLREFGEIQMDITNPMEEALVFRVRVDDDPRADGSRYCRTGGATIAPGETRTFSFPLKHAGGAEFGMKGLPSWPGARSLGSSGWWILDVSHIVAFQIFMGSPPGRKALIVDHVRFGPAPPLEGIVDEFGQYAHADWPGKVYAHEEFAARREAESTDLESDPGPADRDRFGGWAEGPQLEATGNFRTEKVAGKWWLVTPDGRLFFSAGLDGIRPVEHTFITGREQMFGWLPGEDDPLRRYVQQVSGAVEGPIREGLAINWYGLNLERKYGRDPFERWAATALMRLRSWGFNTIANWSDSRLFGRSVPYVVAGGIGGSHNRIRVDHPSAGATIHDPFDPAFAVSARNSLRAQAAAAAWDPYCIGYFVDNEIAWGNRDNESNRYAVATGALAQEFERSPAKRAFVEMLRARYPSLEALAAAWGVAAASWEGITAAPSLNARVRADYSAFVKEHARQYFRVVRGELKSLDPDHLYLGSRFAWFTQEAAEACAEFCDVMSFNVYQRKIAPSNWSFLEALDRPAVIGEFHFGALDRGMFHAGLQAAADQQERARFFREYVESVLDHPSFTGCHWFIAADQPLTGRTRDGENYNIGFVSITDTPYPEMVAAAKAVHATMYRRRFGVPEETAGSEFTARRPGKDQ